FYDRLTYYYVELPKFNKQEHELITREDKWLFVLVNLRALEKIPVSLAEDSIFEQFFMDAKKAHLTELELQAYYQSKKAEWDEFAANETAMNEGRIEGKIEAAAERNRTFIINLLQHTSHSKQEIAKLVGVDLSFVEDIAGNLPG
ncbi:MAG: PD-(D/E)XK nuclease family transposase, partial [Chitinophagaceae bacterium]|nr:PD-(D/E)XK nuclease family transposase [Chitinophagaceae bacterium]